MLVDENITKKDIIRALGERYDYWSARIVLKEAMKESGLAGQDAFEPNQIEDLFVGLLDVGDGVEQIVGELRKQIEPGSETKAKPTKKAKTDEEEPKKAKTDEKEPKKAKTDEEEPKKAKADEEEPKKAKADDRAKVKAKSSSKKTKSSKGKGKSSKESKKK